MTLDAFLAAFWRAVALGCLAAAAPMLLITIPFGLFTMADGNDAIGGGFGAVPLMLAPLIVATPVVVGSCVIWGLPVFLLLRRLRRESASAYCSLGALFGIITIVILLNLMDAHEGHWISMLGGFGGAVSGGYFGLMRERHLNQSAVPE